MRVQSRAASHDCRRAHIDKGPQGQAGPSEAAPMQQLARAYQLPEFEPRIHKAGRDRKSFKTAPVRPSKTTIMHG